MASIGGLSKKRTSASSQCINWYIAALEDNGAYKSLIYLEDEIYHPDEPFMKNHSQTHFKMNNEGTPKSIKYRLNELQDEQLLTLQQFLDVYTSLTELYFEFCSLTIDQFLFIHLILQENPKITHLSWNGNPKPFLQEGVVDDDEIHHIPVHETHLRTYSAQLCNLGPSVAKYLHEALLAPDESSQYLVSLNIGCNKIGDDGCALISAMLRCNRTLQALNISDNFITEKGLLQLLEVFGPFVLTPTEKHDLWKMQLYKMSKVYLPNASMNPLMQANQSITTISVSGIGIDNHPFLTTVKDGMCSGNNTIFHLNIAYNEITSKVLESLIDKVLYQKGVFRGSGLKRVVVDSSQTFPELQQDLTRLFNERPSRTIRPASAI